MTNPNNQITTTPLTSNSLDWDAFDGNSASLNKFLDHSSTSDRLNQFQSTILHHAVTRFNEKKDEATKKTLETIAAHPAKTSYMNHKNSVGQTQLHLAVQLENKEAVQILLNNNADPNIADNDGYTPIEKSQDEEIRQMLLFHSKVSTKLEESEETFTQNQQSNPSSTKGDQQHGQPDQKSDEANHTDNPLQKLHSMCKQETPFNKDLIEKNPGIINQQDEHGWTALHLAAYIGDPALVEFLIKKGAKVAAKDNAQKTPLHCAAAQGHTKVVSIFLKHPETNVNQQDQFGLTPLYCATILRKKPVVKLLIKHNANPSIVNNQGGTALSIARQLEDKEIFEIMVGENNSSNKEELKNENGETSSGSTDTTSLFSISGIWSFFTSFWSGGNSSDVGEGHSNNSTTYESNHSEESNTSLFSWLGSFFTSVWTQKVQDKSTPQKPVVQNPDNTALNSKQIEPCDKQAYLQVITTYEAKSCVLNTNDDRIAKLMAELPDIPEDQDQSTIPMGAQSEEVE